MSERELVQLNIQLPVEALEGFSRLAEQLRRLTEALGGSGQMSAPSGEEQLELGENTAFDFGKFQEMTRGPEEPESVQTDAKEIAGADAVDGAVRRAVADPEGAWTELEAAEVPAAAEELPDQRFLQKEETEAQAVPVSQQEDLVETTRREEEHLTEPEALPLRIEVEERAVEAVPVQIEPDTPLPDAPAVRVEPESQIPAAEEIWTEPEGSAADAVSVQEDIQRALETPPGAGMELTAVPETLKSRWTDVTEELIAAGPAPLTAESVSLAFRRDGRRYDCGFPLY